MARKVGELCCGGFLGRAGYIEAETLQTGTTREDIVEEFGIARVGGEERELPDIPGDVGVGGEQCIESWRQIRARHDRGIHEREGEGAQALAGVGEAGSVWGDAGAREVGFSIAAAGGR